MKIQSKMERRVQKLNDKILELENRGVSERKINWIKKLRDFLERVVTKIRNRIAREPSIVAEYRIPLQVGNKVSGPLYYATMMAGFKFQIYSNPGSKMEGEKASISSRVTNLLHLPTGLPVGSDLIDFNNETDDGTITNTKPDKRDYTAEYFFKNDLVHTIGPQKLQPSESIEYTYQTDSLNPDDINNFKIQFYRKYKYTKHLSKWGRVEAELAVAKDSIAPTWLEGVSPSINDEYVQNFPEVRATVKDSFGRVDFDSIKITLNGASINDKLTISEIDGGAQFDILGDINPLVDKSYTLNFEAKDTTGKLATPNPLTRTIIIDKTLPVISFEELDSLTNTALQKLKISVIDNSPTTTKVFLNGTEISSTDLKIIEIDLNLIEGENSILIQTTDAALNVAEEKSFSITLDTVPPVIGNIIPNDNSYLNEAVFNFSGKSNEPLITVQINLDITPLSTDKLSFSKEITVNDEGDFQVELIAIDLAGNGTTKTYSYTVDTYKPVISLTQEDGVLTNNSSFPLEIIISDDSPTTNMILQNGVEVYQTTDTIINYSATLVEGINTFEIRSIDAAGNEADVINLNFVELDTTPPVLSNIIPVDGTTISEAEFSVSGSSNEKLQIIQVNGIDLNLDSDGKIFSGLYNAGIEGDHELVIIGTDMAGNSSTVNVSTKVVLEVLVKELVSIQIDTTNTDKLIVKGAVGACRPSAELNLYGGYFNQVDITPNSDGSFEVKLDWFSSVKLTAVDETINRTTVATLEWNVDTTLSGVVRDTDDSPLPGVTISILNTDQSVVTNAAGTFSIAHPKTGDQTLVIDGTTIDLADIGPNKKFAKIKLSITLGFKQLNTIERPIYLAPLINDGTATIVEENQSVIVSSPHAPGVEIHIPADVATFPSGGKTGSINITQIDSDKTTISVPEFAVPEKVWAFEPSGLKFSEPVELVLPNIHEFPEGAKLMVISKNSSKGRWELGGQAEVYSDNTIRTTEGNGITHFSEIYVVPYPKDMKDFGSQVKPGADTFNGALTTSVKLPSYKVLGQDIAPSLIYKSSWADPRITISKMFDFPKILYTRHEKWWDIQDYDRTLWIEIEPDFVITTFQSEAFNTTQKYTNMPLKSIVSYNADLSSFDSGIYPYQANYEVHFKGLILAGTIKSDRSLRGPTIWQQTEKTLDEIFSTGQVGEIYVQNKINSEAGRGWKVAGVQRIINPNSFNIMVEEADGGIASYKIDNPINTIHSELDDSVDKKMDGVSFRWPHVYSYQYDMDNERNGHIYKINLEDETPTPVEVGEVSAYKGYHYNVSRYVHPGNAYLAVCGDWWSNYRIPRKLKHFYVSNDDSIFGVDQRSTLFEVNSGGDFTNLTHLPTTVHYGHTPYPHSDYFESWGGSIGGVYYVDGRAPCHPSKMSGTYFLTGNTDGSVSDARFNNPETVIPVFGASEKEFLIADTGNHQIKKVNLDTGVVSTQYGNGLNYDTLNEDGSGSALLSGIKHPHGMVYDSFGNLYVSTEEGHIRKIDQNGIITNFAGKKLGEDDSLVTDEGDASRIVFNNPHGLIIDNTNKYMYVADTGNNRIVRIDMLTGKALRVAGNYTCDMVKTGDAGAALNASLCKPTTLGLDNNNNLLIYDDVHKKIRKVNFNYEAGALINIAYKPESNDLSTLMKNEDGTFTRTYRNGTEVHFNAEGYQTYASDRVGRTVNFEYTNNLLTAQIDPMGSRIEYTYDEEGKLQTVSDPIGRETTFNYDGETLSEVVYPDGTTTGYSYNETGLMLAETDKRGNSTQYVYNSYSRLEKVIKKDLSVIEMNDAMFATIGNNFTGDETGEMKSFGTNEGDLFDGIKDAKGNTTEFLKDYSGYVSTIIDADDRVTTIIRDDKGLPTKITRPDNSEVMFVYDSITSDLLEKYDSTTGATVYFTYDNYGNKLTQTNARGYTSTNTFDNSTGLLLKTSSPICTQSEFTYFALGLVNTKKNCTGKIVSYSYDSFGNIETVTNPLDKVITYDRDSFGNVKKVTNANNQVTTYEYDQFNRLKAVVSPKLERTEYTYLASGELETINDPLGKTTIFEYDKLGQVIKKTNPVGRIIELEYDENGNVILEKISGNITKTFEYDHLDQLVKKILPDNEYNLTYDIRGNVETISNQQTIISYNYKHTEAGDLVDSVISEGIGSFSYLPSTTLSYEYDANGNKTKMITPTGNYTYNYDEADRLRSTTNHKGHSYNYNIDNDNRLASITGGYYSTSYAYNDNNALTQIHHARGNDYISQYYYSLDDIGNKTGVQLKVWNNAPINITYGYDNNNQLTTVSNPQASGNFANETFSYDDIGNRTTDQDGSFTYDETKQFLEEDYNNIYSYDERGNMTSKIKKPIGGESTIYSYSSENQLVKIEFYNASIKTKEVDYVYGALGKRIEKVVNDIAAPVNSFTRRFTYDGSEMLYQVDENNNILAQYTHSGLRTDDMLEVEITAQGVVKGLANSANDYVYFKDALGTVTEVASYSGTKIQHYIYSGFGKLLKITNSSNADITSSPHIDPYFTFTGREYDKESQLYHYRARVYEPAIGRFLQADPDPGLLSIPKSYNNKYSYTYNNPINYNDPSGEFACGGFCVAAIVTLVSITIDSLSEGGNFWDNFGDKFEISNNEIWKVEVLQELALNYLSFGGGNLSKSAKIFATIGFILGRTENYYADREQRGKVNRINLGFGKHKLSSTLNTLGLAVGAIKFWGSKDKNGMTSAEKVEDWIDINVFNKYQDRGWAIPRY